MYRDTTGRRMTLEEAIMSSQLFLGLVTRNYLEDIRNGDRRVVGEIERAKAYRVPTVLLLFEELSEEEKAEAKEVFKEHNILKIVENVPRNHQKLREMVNDLMPEIRKALDELYR